MMKIFTLLCLFISLAQCGRPNEFCWRECDWTEYVALVKCPFADEEPCTCEKRDGTTPDEKDCAAIIGADVKGIQTWEECHDLAEIHHGTTLANEFFRWEFKTTETYCYFLPDCNKEVPSGCVPFEGASCVAGPSDKGCEVVPELTCGPAVWDSEGLHWTCLAANSLETVSPYTEENIAEGTTCQTMDECSTWKWTDEEEHVGVHKVANVKCEADGWKSNPADLELKTNDDIAILPDSNDANDAVCKCDTLSITDATLSENPGLSLICETVFNPEEGGILYGNACALLCDGHFVKYIECYKGKWENTAEYPFQEVTEADIKC